MNHALAGLLLLFSTAWAQPQVKIFTLTHRTSASTLEMVRPLLQKGENCWSEDRLQRLVVKAAPERLEQIRRLLEQIDLPAPQVWLSVRQAAEQSASAEGLLSSSQSHQQMGSSQQLLVMSGERGEISLGQDIVQVQPYWNYCQEAGLLPPGVVFQRVGTGFSVEPTVVGQTIRLKVVPWLSYQSPQGPGRIQFQEAATSLVLNNGDTIALSNSQSQNQAQRSALGLILRSSLQDQAMSQVWVQAEIKSEP